MKKELILLLSIVAFFMSCNQSKNKDAGVIENSAVVEGLTSLLIYINKPVLPVLDNSAQ
jgi:hypothetical protein